MPAMPATNAQTDWHGWRQPKVTAESGETAKAPPPGRQGPLRTAARAGVDYSFFRLLISSLRSSISFL
jgi:hypothetical protein